MPVNKVTFFSPVAKGNTRVPGAHLFVFANTRVAVTMGGALF